MAGLSARCFGSWSSTGTRWGSSSPRPSAPGIPEETSRRIELLVGRDLQFIRINGTLVGGLVGLLIYTVMQLV